MSESVSNTANQGFDPDQATVARALQDAQQRGDAAAVAIWQAAAERLNLPDSVRGIAPNPTS